MGMRTRLSRRQRGLEPPDEAGDGDALVASMVLEDRIYDPNADLVPSPEPDPSPAVDLDETKRSGVGKWEERT